MAAKQYGYQKERKGEGYSIWTLGLSGSRQDVIGYARTARDAQRKINKLHAADEAASTPPATRHHATKKTKKPKAATVGALYAFGGPEYSELHDPGARVVYRVVNPSTAITHEFDNKKEALEMASERSLKERGEVAVEQGTLTSAGILRYDLKPQFIRRSEWRAEAKPSRHHSTKKSPAQLQREIDETLAGMPTGVTNLDRILDRVTSQHEVTIDAAELAPAQVEKVRATAKARGLHVSGTGRWILVRRPPTFTEDARQLLATRAARNKRK